MVINIRRSTLTNTQGSTIVPEIVVSPLVKESRFIKPFRKIVFSILLSGSPVSVDALKQTVGNRDTSSQVKRFKVK